MKKAVSAFIFRFLGLFLGVTGITLHLMFVSTPDADFMGAHVMAYFTIQTNFFSTFLFLYLLLKQIYVSVKNKEFKYVSMNQSVHLALTFFITITMLGYWLALVPMSGLPKKPMLVASNLILHTFTPLMAIFECAFFSDHGVLNIKEPLKWLIYPITYLISAIIIANVTTEPYYTIQNIPLMYPYPFLDPQFVGIGGMIGIIIALAIFFVLFGMLYVFIDNKLKKKN